MPKGIVVSFEKNSGFGFIETEEGGAMSLRIPKEIASKLRNDLASGQH